MSEQKPAPKLVSPYMTFATEVKSQIKREHPDMKMTDLIKIVDLKWKQLSKDERKAYDGQ